jgi:hypothetical protein
MTDPDDFIHPIPFVGKLPPCARCGYAGRDRVLATGRVSGVTVCGCCLTMPEARSLDLGEDPFLEGADPIGGEMFRGEFGEHPADRMIRGGEQEEEG